MPVRKGKNARQTLVHDNTRRPKRGSSDWFDEYYRDLYGEDWSADTYNEKGKKVNEEADSD